jgi:hypothetical protein
MIYTAPCVRFLMRADTLHGEVGGGGGGGAGNLNFFGPQIALAYHVRRYLQVKALILMLLSRDWGKMIQEKNMKQKIL